MRRSFRAGTAACADLKPYYRRGLRGLRVADRVRICASDPRKLTGSIDIDSALKQRLPAAPRWDYAIGYEPDSGRDEVVHWVEVHPATDGEVGTVKRKLAWLKHWMRENARELAAMERRFIWVASGRSALSPVSPARRSLAQAGCRFVGRIYRF